MLPMPKLDMIGGCSSCSYHSSTPKLVGMNRQPTENSHKTKLLVSLKLKSLVLCKPSPTLPPLPTFRPALSFFFFAVRTLLKCNSIFEGNCNAGRWKERASCFDRRVLYCDTTQPSKDNKVHKRRLTKGS